MLPPALLGEGLEALRPKLGLQGVWGQEGWMGPIRPPLHTSPPHDKTITNEAELAALALDQGHGLSQPQQVVFSHQAWMLGHQV